MSRVVKSRDGVLQLQSTDGKVDLLDSSGTKVGEAGSGIGQNTIINGNFDIWQRGSSFAGISSGSIAADRWQIINDNGTGTMNIAQSSDVPTTAQSGFKSNFSNLIDITGTSAIAAAHRTDYRYKIEGYDFVPLAGQEITLSFWIKATKTGINCVYFQNEATNRSYIVEYTVNSSETWEKKEITFTHDETGTWNYTNGKGLQWGFVLAAGTNNHGTADTWLALPRIATSNQINNLDSASNNFRIAQVKIEKGSSATAFTRAGNNIQDELAMCQRYYEKSYTSGVNPGTATFTNSNASALSTTYTGIHRLYTSYKVTKRTAPTITIYDPNTGTSGNVVSLTVATGLGSPAAVAASAADGGTKGFIMQTGSVSTAGFAGHWTADSEL